MSSDYTVAAGVSRGTMKPSVRDSLSDCSAPVAVERDGVAMWRD